MNTTFRSIPAPYRSTRRPVWSWPSCGPIPPGPEAALSLIALSDGRPSTPARQATAAEEAAAYVSRYRWIILLGLITAAIMEVLDTTIINVALPQMAGNLGATQQEISWVSTGYILSNVVVLR